VPYIFGAQVSIYSSADGERQPYHFMTAPFCSHFEVVEGKAVLSQAWSGPNGSGKLRFPKFMSTAQDGSKVVSLTHRPPLPPRNTPGTHFC